MSHNELAWYGWVIIGACIGLYLHNHRTRHIVHWLLIKLLRSFIWIFHKTDPLYDELDNFDYHDIEPEPEPPKVKKIKPAKSKRAKGVIPNSVEATEQELKDWTRNPEVSVVEKV